MKHKKIEGLAREHMPDSEIIDLYWKRDERAILETDNKYGKYLYVIAYNIVHDRMDCEECLDDTYLGAWNSIPPHRPNVFQVFLSRIMRNIAVDKLRAASAAKRVPSEMMVSLSEIGESLIEPPTMDEELAIARMSELLNSFVRSLNDREQFIFVCRYYYADKIDSIASMLRVGEATVYRELADIRRRLEKYLKEEGILNG